MQRPLLTLVGLFIVSACSGEAPAQSDGGATQGAQLDTASQLVSKPTLIKGNRQEKRYIQAMEDGLQSQMKLYSRVSPAAAAMIKPVSFDAADRAVIRCSFTGMKRAGLSAYLDAGVDANKALNKAIEDNPNVSIQTLEQHPDIMALMQGGDMMQTMSDADEAKIQAVNKDCGVIAMMMKKMTESGAVAAMSHAITD